jgi:hypothetical protein
VTFGNSDIRESRAHPLPLRKSVDVATAVVLMPRLPVPDAAAVVLRRPSLWPASVITLQEDSLSVGAFESALFALSNEVTRGGGVEAPSSLSLPPTVAFATNALTARSMSRLTPRGFDCVDAPCSVPPFCRGLAAMPPILSPNPAAFPAPWRKSSDERSS